MRETDGRKYLFSLIPTDVTYRTVALMIVFTGVAVFGIFKGRNLSDIVQLFFFMATPIIVAAILQIYINKGYRVSYDDEALYLRPDGIGWNLRYKPDRVMRYDEIGELYASSGNMGLSPFEFIEVQRIGWDGEERFFLSRVFLRENQLKECLRFVYSKIPHKFPQDVIDYMDAEPGWIELQQMKASD
jgi:hypothetical protein